MRELRNNGADVLARVESGEELIVTRDGEPVAMLSPLPRRPLTRDQVVARFSALPPVDHAAMRAEIDALIDPEL